ncbi:MAG: rod shape-determining protein MreD [Alistipes sp.]|nr:rod shape-determining protein MreD [Alistipes sp.]
MQRNLTYVGIFLTLVLLQVFLFDNIALSVYFHPLIYIAFIIILPLDMRPVWVLLLSALLGLTVDMATGQAGLNVMSTTAVGFMRTAIVGLICGRSMGFDDTIPSLHRFTTKNLVGYVVAMVVVHSAIYFFMESLSMMHILHTLLRLVISDIVAVFVVWYIVRLIIERVLKN